VVREAFREVVAELRDELGDDAGEWRWGIRHYLEPRHLFGGKTILAFMNLPRLEMPGGLDSPWKAHFNLDAPGSDFRVVAGPAFRMVVDLSDVGGAEFGLDTGESGWPLSPHYGDLYEKWGRGELVAMHYDWDEIHSGSRAHLRLMRPELSPGGVGR
jgi:penicillin amidase